MKEHKDAFDGWLKDQVDHAPVPNPDAYWEKTSAKLPGNKSAWVKWFLPMLLLVGSIGGALYFMSDRGETDQPLAIEKNEVSGNDNEEVKPSEMDAFDEVQQEWDAQDEDVVLESETKQISSETQVNQTAGKEQPTTNESTSAQSRTASTSKQTTELSEETTARQQADVQKQAVIKSAIVAEDNTEESVVAKSETTTKEDNKADNKTNLAENNAASEDANSPVENTEENIESNVEEIAATPKQVVRQEETKDNSIESIEEDETTELLVDAEEEEDEKAIPQVLKKISDQPKWTAFTGVSGGVLPFSTEIMPVAALEVGAEYAFTPKWGISGAALFTVLSNVNTSTQFTRINYEFDRIEETATLTFSQASYLQIPIRVHYRKNRHMFTAGVVPGVVVNGRASLRDFGEESSTESVWGYTEGIRRWNIAGAVEYDYSISENWQVGLLFHGSPQTIMLDNNTSGGFQYIQLRIRKWW